MSLDPWVMYKAILGELPIGEHEKLLKGLKRKRRKVVTIYCMHGCTHRALRKDAIEFVEHVLWGRT